jgi:hypothetical protein
MDASDDGWDCESQIDISISVPGICENRARCFCAEVAIARKCCSDWVGRVESQQWMNERPVAQQFMVSHTLAKNLVDRIARAQVGQGCL